MLTSGSIANAAMSGHQIGTGRLPNNSRSWVDAYERLKADDEALRKVAEFGLQIAKQSLEADCQRERHEEVSGFWN
jgi:hypothetical protein